MAVADGSGRVRRLDAASWKASPAATDALVVCRQSHPSKSVSFSGGGTLEPVADGVMTLV